MKSRRSILSSLSAFFLGLLLATCPLGVSFDPNSGFYVKSGSVLAESGPGKDGDGRDDDDDDDSDDDDDDSDDDDSDDDDDDDDNSGSGSANSGSGSSSSSGSSGSVTSNFTKVGGNLRLVYSNGWEERIRNGRYRLTDPKGRTVSFRAATEADVIRMRQIAGQ